MRIVLLSLRIFNDRPIINYDLTASLTNYFDHQSDIFEIKLPTGTIHLNKFQYLNKAKIYEDPKNSKCFFMIFSYKRIKENSAFKILMEYALNKLEGRISHLQSLKQSYSKLIAA